MFFLRKYPLVVAFLILMGMTPYAISHRILTISTPGGPRLLEEHAHDWTFSMVSGEPLRHPDYVQIRIRPNGNSIVHLEFSSDDATTTGLYLDCPILSTSETDMTHVRNVPQARNLGDLFRQQLLPPNSENLYNLLTQDSMQ